MISLIIGGQELDLSAAATIELFRSYSWLFEDKEGDYSLTFALAQTPTNNKVFSYANDGNIKTVGKSYDATLKLFGNTFKRGSVKLNKCSRTGYECIFVAGRSNIDTTKYLHEVLNGSIVIGDTTYNFLKDFTTGAGDFCFPHLARNKDFFNFFLEFPYGAFDPITNPSAGNYASDCPVSPCFTLKAILYNLLGSLGYERNFAANTILDQLQKIIFVTGTDIRHSNISGELLPDNASITVGTLPSIIYYKDFMPWITIGDFLKGLYYHCGVMVIFDEVTKNAYVVNYTSMVADTLDITQYVEPNPEVDFDPEAGVELAFKIDENDRVLAFEPKDLEAYLDKQIDEDNYSTISALAPAFYEFAALNREDNSWYIYKPDPAGSDWEFYARDKFGFKIVRRTKKVQIPWMPVVTDDFVLFDLEQVELRDNGSGDVRIYFAKPAIGTNIFFQGKARLTGSQEYDAETWFDIIAQGAMYVDLDLTWTIDEDIENGCVAQATANNTYNLIIAYAFNRMPTIQQNLETLRKNDVPRVAIYFGLQPNEFLSSRFPMASSYNINIQNTVIGDYALRLFGEDVEDSALHYFHQHMFDIYADYRLFTWFAHLPANLLTRLNALRTCIVIRGTRYLLVEKNESVNQNGTEEATELKLLKIK